MSGSAEHPRVEVAVAAGGMILIKQMEGVSDDRAVVAIHPRDLPELIERLSTIAQARRSRDEPES